MGILDKLFGAGTPPPRESTVPTPRVVSQSPTDPTPTPRVPIELQGDGRFHVPVVGESRRLDSFNRIFGPRTPEGLEKECDASLVLEDDNPVDDRAVRVEINGLQVGYLSREHARDYRDWLEARGHREGRAVVRALVRGGWDRGADDSGDYGVTLDLPSDAVRDRRVRERRSGWERDEHGQPNEWFNLTRRIDRSVHELLGLTKGIIADGQVTADETVMLRSWMAANPEAASAWPGSVLAERLDRIFADGRVDEAEREDLRHLLKDLAGAQTNEVGNPATRLPLDEPPPALEFNGHVFVFTGRFFSGTRRWCEEKVESRGGACSSGVTRRTNYLVIGELGSRDWKHTSFGRKIQRAVEVRSEGRPLAIVAEDHWAACM